MSTEREIEFWRLPTVTEKTGLSKSEIYRRIAANLFPKPRKYPGSTKTFWVSTEVQDWQRALLTLTDIAPGRSAT